MQQRYAALPAFTLAAGIANISAADSGSQSVETAERISDTSGEDRASGLQRILGGIQVGDSVDRFAAAHPGALRVDTGSDEITVARGKRKAAFHEQYERDPWLGLWFLGNYGFADGKLAEYTLLWQGPEKDVLAQRERFFEACLAKHGRLFRREVMNVDPGPNRHPAPVLVWHEGDYSILASYALHTRKEQPARGSFTYAVLPRRDPFLQSALIGYTLKPRKVNEVYVGLDTLLNKILLEHAETSAAAASPEGGSTTP